MAVVCCATLFVVIDRPEKTSFIEVPKDLKPTADVRFAALYDSIAEITTDDLLNGMTNPPEMQFSSGEVLPTNCLVGNTVQIYGSNEAYQAVLLEYIQKFEGWQYDHRTITLEAGTSQERREDFFTAQGILITLYPLAATSPELENIVGVQNYRTYYRVAISYQEPRHCSWEDNPALVRD